MFTIFIVANDPHPAKRIQVREQVTAIAIARLLMYDPHILVVDVFNEQGEKII